MNADRMILVTARNCPQCSIVKEYLTERNIAYEIMDAEKNRPFCRRSGIMSVPTMLIYRKEEVNQLIGTEEIIKYIQESV